MKNITLIVVGLIILGGGFKFLTKKTPEQVEFEQQIEVVSLEGKVEEFPIEGREHVSAETSVEYGTTPPTSGGHLSQAKGWGVYDKKIDDKAGVHGIEHGGLWITYKDIDEQSVQILKDLGKTNSQSVIVSPRSENDDKIVISSWGKFMKLESVDKALIQKYINTYKNQSPEKLSL